MNKIKKDYVKLTIVDVDLNIQQVINYDMKKQRNIRNISKVIGDIFGNNFKLYYLH
jgi:hypothetical protein